MAAPRWSNQTPHGRRARLHLRARILSALPPPGSALTAQKPPCYQLLPPMIHRAFLRLTAGLCLALALGGCTRRVTSEAAVFRHYFGEAPPAGADIRQANYWATYRVGLDEEELVLEAFLPGTFMTQRLPDLSGASPPEPASDPWATASLDASLNQALDEAPNWFRPPNPARCTFARPRPGLTVVSFGGEEVPPARFQIWLHPEANGRVYIERPTGHVLVHYGLP